MGIKQQLIKLKLQSQNNSLPTVMQVTERCINCSYSRLKLNELMDQYEQLIRTKQEEIVCSHRIIAELEHQLSQTKRALVSNGVYYKELERNNQKVLQQQQDTIEYLKSRQVRLLQQMKETEKQVFKLTINNDDNIEIIKQFDVREHQNRPCVTPKKSILVSNSGNVTLSKQRENTITLEKLFEESIIRASSDSKQSIKLKVAEDRLQLMNIKYKMALLKTVEVATLR